MPGPILAAGLMLAGRAASVGGRALPSLGITSQRTSQVLKFLGVATAIEAADRVLEMFGLDIIPDFDNPNSAAEAVINIARSAEDFMVPNFRPDAIPPEWDLPGYYVAYSFKDGRGWWYWKQHTAKMEKSAVERALTPRTTVRSAPATRNRARGRR